MGEEVSFSKNFSRIHLMNCVSVLQPSSALFDLLPPPLRLPSGASGSTTLSQSYASSINACHLE